MAEMIQSFKYQKAITANAVDPKGHASSPLRQAAMENEMAIAEEDRG